MAQRKDSMLGCGECGRMLPSSQFKHKRKPADIKLANMWVNTPCNDCVLAEKLKVQSQVIGHRIEDGFKVTTLKSADIHTPYDYTVKPAVKVDTHWLGRKL